LSSIFKIFYLFIFIFSKPILASEECSIENNLKVGLMSNDFIDYKYYLYYEIGNFAKENNVDFELGFVDKNIDEFDIIFGEFSQLKRLSISEISLPDQIKKFYKDNGLEINENILPLDLDTLIVLSNENYSLKNLNELSNLYSPIKYTFGMNFNNYDELSRLILFSSNQKTIKIETNTIESTLNSFNKLYSNANKNILDANFLELYNSHENKENLFTLFSDGILLYKNLQDSYFNLFPQNNYKWNEDLGKFNKNSNSIPFSYYGFSAYVNNSKQIGLLCHFTKMKIRENAFKNFNLQISPLSMNELKNFINLPIGYEDIINLKNKNIIDIDKNLLAQIDLIRDVIFGNQNYSDLIESNNYLN
tara:strand:+ start:385 stop:1470 length:1086 start_codon:yes stop_codon:yes gene_type:complete